MAKRRLESLTLFDYSDRELLHIISEEQDEDGWTDSSAIAIRLGLDTDYPNANVGMRLGWLRRYGAVEKHPERPKAWGLTHVGRALMNGDLARDEVEMLDGLDSAKMLMITRYLTGRYRRSGVTASHLIRREWQRGTKRNSK